MTKGVKWINSDHRPIRKRCYPSLYLLLHTDIFQLFSCSVQMGLYFTRGRPKWSSGRPAIPFITSRVHHQHIPLRPRLPTPEKIPPASPHLPPAPAERLHESKST